jgi:hypothetical protein
MVIPPVRNPVRTPVLPALGHPQNVFGRPLTDALPPIRTPVPPALRRPQNDHQNAPTSRLGSSANMSFTPYLSDILKGKKRTRHTDNDE